MFFIFYQSAALYLDFSQVEDTLMQYNRISPVTLPIFFPLCQSLSVYPVSIVNTNESHVSQGTDLLRGLLGTLWAYWTSC